MDELCVAHLFGHMYLKARGVDMVKTRSKRYYLALVLATMALTCTSGAVAQPIEHIYTWPGEKDIGYAQIVRHGEHLYIAGMVGEGVDQEAQMRDIYKRLLDLLKPYGADTRHIAREVIYTRDIEALKKAIPARLAYFPQGQFPASSWVQVDRLYKPQDLIEIEFEVILPRP